MHQTVEAESDALRSCIHDVYSSDEFEAIRRHVPPDGDARLATAAQLNDSAYPTDDEKQSYLSGHARLTECKRAFLGGIQNVAPPRVVQLTAQVQTEGEYVFADLMNGKISYGEMLVRQRTLSDKFGPPIKEAYLTASKELQAAAQKEFAERAATRAAISSFLYASKRAMTSAPRAAAQPAP